MRIRLLYILLFIIYRQQFDAVKQTFKSKSLASSSVCSKNVETTEKPLSTNEAKLIDALKLFRNKYGHVNVPQNFKIPLSTDWPHDLRDVKLGIQINKIRIKYRTGKLHNEEVIQQLNHLKFQWNTHESQYIHMIEILAIYYQRYGHIQMKTDYCIPSNILISESMKSDPIGVKKTKSMPPEHDDPSQLIYQWPNQYHGYKLGLKLYRFGREPEKLSLDEKKLFYNHMSPITTKLYEFHQQYLSNISISTLIGGVNNSSNITLTQLISLIKQYELTQDIKEHEVILDKYIYTLINEDVPSIVYSTKIEQIIHTIQQYHIKYNHTCIPTDYMIDARGNSVTYALEFMNMSSPVEKWNKSYRDIHLGKLITELYNISKYVCIPLLQHVNYTLITPLTKGEYDRFMLDLTAIQIYKDIYQDVNIPSYFYISDNGLDSWSLPHITKITNQVSSSKTKKRSPNNKKSTSKDNNNNNEDIKKASSYIWPKPYHGLNLGYHIHLIRKRQRYTTPEQRQILTNIGLDLQKSSRKQSFDLIVLALKAHYQFFGDYLVPRYFIVPKNDPDWPEKTWGMKLGVKVHGIKHNRTYTSIEQRAVLEQIGFTT